MLSGTGQPDVTTVFTRTHTYDSNIITARVAKVMFSQACVTHYVQPEGGGRCDISKCDSLFPQGKGVCDMEG